MKDSAPTLFEAVGGFLGPLLAEYARLVDEFSADTPVVIKIGGYEHETTLASIKALDRAYYAAFEAKCKREARKSVGSLL